MLDREELRGLLRPTKKSLHRRPQAGILKFRHLEQRVPNLVLLLNLTQRQVEKNPLSSAKLATPAGRASKPLSTNFITQLPSQFTRSVKQLNGMHRNSLLLFACFQRLCIPTSSPFRAGRPG